MMLNIFLIAAIYAFFSVISFLWIKKDAPIKADLIVVLSGPNRLFTKNRLRKAAEMYKKHYGTSVIVSGRYLAGWMANELVNLGVSRRCIVVQDRATNTLEDAIYNVKMMSMKKSIILVTAGVHQRRAYMTFNKVSKKKITNMPSDDVFTLLSFLLPTGWLVTSMEMIKYLIYKKQRISG